MKHPVSRTLFSYWDRIREGRSAPERSDIDPAEIRGLLSDTFILGAEGDPGHVTHPIRLSGTRLNALFLAELKGRPLLDLWHEGDRPAVDRMIAAVLADTTPLVAGVRAAPLNHRAMDLEMVLLPLRHQGRTQSRILGAIAPIERPAWLGLLPVTGLTLTSMRVIDVEDSVVEPLPMPRAAACREADDRRVVPRRYGRFTVHDGGR